jgi:hypothetical protein
LGTQLVQAGAENKEKLKLIDTVCKSLIKQMNKGIQNLNSKTEEHGHYFYLTIDENSDYHSLYRFWSMDDENSFANKVGLLIENWGNECNDLRSKEQDEQRELMTSIIQQLEAIKEKKRIGELAITQATRDQFRELYKEEREYLLSE